MNTDDSICESSLPPNKSSGDIGERTWTPEQFWEFTEGRDGGFRAQQQRDVMEDAGLVIVPAAEIERLRRESAHRLACWRDVVKKWNAAESAVAAAYENAAKIAENLRFAILPDQMNKWELAEAQRRAIASAIRAAVSKKTAED